MNPIEDLSAIMEEVRGLHIRYRTLIVQVSEAAKKSKMSRKELCDAGFLARETSKMFNEMRKDSDAMKSLVDRIACISIMSEAISNPGMDATIRTELCSGTPHVKKVCSLPSLKNDPEAFYAMMAANGVSKEEADKGILRVSWKKMSEMVTLMTEDGKQLPKFIPKVFDEHTITHRRKANS